MFARTQVALLLAVTVVASAAMFPTQVAAQAAATRPRAVVASGVVGAEAEYVPLPASAYVLTAADAGPGFREVAPSGPVGDGAYANRFFAPDASVDGNLLILSGTTHSVVESRVDVFAPGGDGEAAARVAQLVEQLRGAGADVQAAPGWGSEQVFSYIWARPGVYTRGMLLKHRNAVASTAIVGREQVTTWDASSHLMSVVEGRILAALVKPGAEGGPQTPPASGGTGPDPRLLTLTPADLPSGFSRDEGASAFKERPDPARPEDLSLALAVLRPTGGQATESGLILVTSLVDRYTEPAAAESALRERAQVSFSKELGFDEVPAPSIADGARAFVRKRPDSGLVMVAIVARRGPILFMIAATGQEQAAAFGFITPLMGIVDARIQQALGSAPTG
jgi:hypothetical protein